MAKKTTDSDETVMADLDAMVDVGDERMSVEDLITTFLATRAERDTLAEAVETFGLQPARPVPPIVKRAEPLAHGTLAPTDGATGVTRDLTKGE